MAAAVVLPRDSELVGVTDSKLLDEDERERLFDEIVRKATGLGIALGQPRLIDTANILNATLMTMRRAAENLKTRCEIVLIDGRDRIESEKRVATVVGGDARSLSIAAASIVAKVTRDRMMRRLHRRYPEYNFLQNKGYGTKAHLDAIDRHGVIPEHRRSFLAKLVEKTPTLF